MLMGVERIEAIVQRMMAEGVSPDLPVALVRWGTTPRQEVLRGTLRDIGQRWRRRILRRRQWRFSGRWVSLGEELGWQHEGPLSGKRIVVTRTRKQASALSERLRALGGEVIEIPTIRIETAKRSAPLPSWCRMRMATTGSCSPVPMA